VRRGGKKKPKKPSFEDDDFVTIPLLKKDGDGSSSSSDLKEVGETGVSSTSSIPGKPGASSDEKKSEIPKLVSNLRIHKERLRTDASIWKNVPTELLNGFKTFLFPANRVFKFNLGWFETISVNSSSQFGGSSSGGSFTIVDFISATEWASLQALFDEVYVEMVQAHYLPRQQYRATTPGSTSSCGMVWVSLHHNAGTYTDARAMCANPTARISTTNHPNFVYTWKNIERVTGTSPSMQKAGTAVPTQGWCSTNTTSMAAYSGAVQYIAMTTMTDWTSQNIADVITLNRLWFRNRA
jgi:hypothetical protein